MFDGDYLDLTSIVELCLECIPYSYIQSAHMKKKGVKAIPLLKRYLKSVDIDDIETEDNLIIKKCDAEKFTNFYKDFNVDDYYITVEVCKLLGVSNKNNFWLKQQFKIIYYKNKNYFNKDEVNDYIKAKHNLLHNKCIPISKSLPVLSEKELHKEYLNSIALITLYCQYFNAHYKTPNQIHNSLKLYFKHMNINFIETEDNLYIKKVDADLFVNFVKNFKNSSEYYTKKQIADLFGIVKIAKYLNQFIQPIFYKNQLYFPKPKVDYFVKLKAETSPLFDLKKELGVSIDRIKSTVNQLQFEGCCDVKLFQCDEHPFGNYCLIKGYDEVKKRLQLEIELTSIIDRLQYYQRLSRELKNKNELCPQTLLDFDAFVVKRYNSTTEKIAKPHAILCQKLSKHLCKELLKYSEEELANLTSQMLLNYQQGKEFHLFLDYLYQIYGNKIPKSSFIRKLKNQDKSYNVNQWECFQLLVFGSIDEIEYLQKALRVRTLAMTWCYFALHFVTIWRKGQIEKFYFPNLQLIGFQDGREFLDYMNKNIGQMKIKNMFTATMGEIICNDISLRMKTRSENHVKMEVFYDLSLVKVWSDRLVFY